MPISAQNVQHKITSCSFESESWRRYAISGNGGYIEYAIAEWCELLEIDHRNAHEAFEEGISEEEYAKRKAVMDASSEDVKRFELGYDGPFDAADYPAQPPRLGETLKRLRLAAGLTQSNLADAAGVSVFAIRVYAIAGQAHSQQRATKSYYGSAWRACGDAD